jgi:ribosomal protein S18 acetylase RimI-like enzyme
MDRNYSIRRLTRDELRSPEWVDAILDLDRENMKTVLDGAALPFPEENRRRGLAGESTVVIALLRGDELAGYAEFGRDWDDARDLYAGSIQLRRRYRGTAAMGALLLASLRYLRTERFRQVRAGVQANNDAAIRLYRRLGFEVRPRADTDASLAVTAERAVLESAAVRRLEAALARRWGERVMDGSIKVRTLTAGDLGAVASAFAQWPKPAQLFERYLAEQADGLRVTLVVWCGGEVCGYGNVVWESGYPPFREEGLPEIQDLNVLPGFRRRGIGGRLLDEAERLVSARSPRVGIGVGLYADYGAAQRLYVRRGYVPDGRGIHYNGRPVSGGARVVVDDDLALYLVKDLAAKG